MQQLSTLMVGGTFDRDGGKPSGLFAKLAAAAASDGRINTTVVNGGCSTDLQALIDLTPEYRIVFWFANVPNDLPKIRNVKLAAPHCMLVTSKRNDGAYGLEDLIMRALESKSNLLMEFDKSNGTPYRMCVLDPLGCVWHEGYDPGVAMAATLNRLMYLASVTRQSTTHVDGSIVIPDETAFVDTVREIAETVQAIMPEPPDTPRFLGNASFREADGTHWRCSKTMPSFSKNGTIYVSRRNVPKRFITHEDFVPVQRTSAGLFYLGDCKPSVDTPIQVRLYEKLPRIRYMVHTHCYIENAPFTQTCVPCGGLEEVDEIMNTAAEHYGTVEANAYAVNLKGHGSIAMAATVDILLANTYVARPFPEYVNLPA